MNAELRQRDDQWRNTPSLVKPQASRSTQRQSAKATIRRHSEGAGAAGIHWAGRRRLRGHVARDDTGGVAAVVSLVSRAGLCDLQ
jgi:hypothetical protein